MMASTIDVSDVTNVTFTGEHSCTATGREQYGCTPAVVYSEFELAFISSSNVSVCNLRFAKYTNNEYQGIYPNVHLTFDRVRNVVLQSLDAVFTNPLSDEPVGEIDIILIDPCGECFVSNLNFSHGRLRMWHLVDRSSCNYSMKISNTHLEQFVWKQQSNTNFATLKSIPILLKLSIENSSFFKRISTISLSLLSDINISVNNCSFVQGGLDIFIVSTKINFTCTMCTFKHSVTSNPLRVSIANSQYTHPTSSVMIAIKKSFFINNTGGLVLDVKPFILGPWESGMFLARVWIKNVTFVGNRGNPGSRLLSVSYAEVNPRQVNSYSLLHFVNCSFQYNHFYSHLIYLEGLYRVIFDGHTVIRNNTGGGVHLKNIVIWLKGVLDIVDNNSSQITSGLRIEGKSYIHFRNNTQISIINNEGFGVYQSEYYSNFNNSVSSATPCFFRFSFSHSNVPEHLHASLIVSNNSLVKDNSEFPTAPGNQIYNAHLPVCQLSTSGRGHDVNRTKLDVIRKYVKLDSWDKTTVGSPPSRVCSCDLTQPNNRSHWDCSNTTFTITVYPGTPLSIAVVTLGDYDFVQPASVTVGIRDAQSFQLSVKIDRCTRIPLHHVSSSFVESLVLTAKGVLKDSKTTVSRNVIISTNHYCPPGMSFVQVNSSRICECEDSLSSHGFHCAIELQGYNTVITFKVAKPRYWMGYWNEEMVFSDSCPLHYCDTVNSTLSTTGLTLDHMNTSIQCDAGSRRQGLLCSQCSPGTSSQIGSFRCGECTFAGLLLIPAGAIIGIVLVALLFLFNFTVLQGDIAGIAFYANTVGIMDEFLLTYTPKPFYLILSVLNLGLGFETCFFDGMDEFSKAIVQFIFPFYLLFLTISIIIAAHKFNLKIFRVRFVARRSVPVLATMMLLTYSGLINAVIFGLQYTTIYSVEDGTPHLVWMHQPELEYFKGKHIAVGVLCLIVVVFYLLPLTVVTLFGDLLRVCSRNLWFSHFMDVFHGAFRYPFGFWFGSRLLLRITFIILSITTSTPVVAYTMFLTIGGVLLLQQLLKPFRTDNVTIYRPDPERKISRKDWLKVKISEIFRPKVIDSLYLLNIMFIATAIFGSPGVSSSLTRVGVCLSILLALAELLAIGIHHAYHYFPLPSNARERMESLRERWYDLWLRIRKRIQGKRNQVHPPENGPVQITYLSASMCFNNDVSSDSGEEKYEIVGNEEEEAREEVAML